MLRGGPAPSLAELRLYYATLMDETGRALRHYTPAGHCNRMKKYLAFCYPDFSPSAEHTLRRTTDPAEMLSLLEESTNDK